MDNPSGYLYRVGCSKTRRRRSRVLFDAPTAPGEPEVEPALAAALARLSAHQRTAVVLVKGYGWELHEVADLTGTSVSTVNTHVRRGLDRLRTELGVERMTDDLSDRLRRLVDQAQPVDLDEVTHRHPVRGRHPCRLAVAGLAVLAAIAGAWRCSGSTGPRRRRRRSPRPRRPRPPPSRRRPGARRRPDRADDRCAGRASGSSWGSPPTAAWSWSTSSPARRSASWLAWRSDGRRTTAPTGRSHPTTSSRSTWSPCRLGQVLYGDCCEPASGERVRHRLGRQPDHVPRAGPLRRTRLRGDRDLPRRQHRRRGRGGHRISGHRRLPPR